MQMRSDPQSQSHPQSQSRRNQSRKKKKKKTIFSWIAKKRMSFLTVRGTE